MTVKRNRENNQRTILATEALLQEIIKSPDEFKNNDGLVNALKSQGGLAKYDDADRHIGAVAINTVKSLSELLLDDGFDGFDRLRINAREAIGKALTGKINSPDLASVIYELGCTIVTNRLSYQY